VGNFGSSFFFGGADVLFRLGPGRDALPSGVLDESSSSSSEVLVAE
jgi:hypothetical protein